MNLIKRDSVLKDFFCDIFDETYRGIESGYYGYPKFNVVEDDNGYKIETFYPGIKKDNFNVKVEDGKKIVISSSFSEDKSESQENCIYKEFVKKEFSKKFILPEEVIKTKITATYQDGVLVVEIPKDKVKAKERNFEIKIN